jgi:NhaP-type Na+/H+ or K+/H+ antiporter
MNCKQLMIVRGIIILALYPVISRGKLMVTANDSVFMVWGGLRGALGIALALDVQVSV